MFAQEAIDYILAIKNRHPEKKLSIVVVVDPLKRRDEDLTEQESLQRDGFPKNSVDKIEYAPIFDRKCEKYSNRFVQRFYKINRWLYQQCDDMNAYYYDNLPNTTLRFAKSAVSGKSRLTMRHLYLPDTRDRIDILIEQLSERERAAVLALNTGKNLSGDCGRIWRVL